MNMKCDICGKGMATTFLGKVKGTYVKDSKGKLRAACFECQSRFKNKQSLLQQLQ